MSKKSDKKEKRTVRVPPPSALLHPKTSREQSYQRMAILVLMAILLTLIIVPKGGFVPDYYRPGDVASRDIKAPREVLVEDRELTATKKVEASEAVRPFYDLASGSAQAVMSRILRAIELAGTQGEDGVLPADFWPQLEKELGFVLSEEELAGLLRLPESGDLMPDLRRSLTPLLQQRIVGNLDVLLNDLKGGILVRDLGTQKEFELRSPQKIRDPATTLEEAGRLLEQAEGLDPQSRLSLFAMLRQLIRPNLTFNKQETEVRKVQASEAVAPVLFQLKKGEMIVREGERVSEAQIKKLRALRDIGSDSSTLSIGLGLLLAIGLLFQCGHRFAKRNLSTYNPVNRDLFFLSLCLLGLIILIKLSIFIFSALGSTFPYIDASSYYYLFPFAFGAMLVRMVLSAEVALLFAILSSVLLGILFGNSLEITLFVLAASLTGIHGLRQCKERTVLYKAGMRVSLVSLLMVVAIHFQVGRAADLQLLYKSGFALLGGFFSSVLVTGMIPLLESLFKYTTDIKLLELANLNTRALRELMIQAPGTYHHSIVVGNLVEAAAEKVNANPLLARVAAYYHDVGKVKKPLYFIENVREQENKHDKLAPSMSALILTSHVKDGVEIARENKLGETILDIIRQHHGTGLIKFFYDKAKNKADPDVQQISERDYRYPGPKPQSKEAALIMLADAVEAASRTLTDPTPARIQGVVQKIINNIFIDGQLDECNLTLKDLHSIAKSFNRILSGIFHQRIDYPDPAYKERDKDAVKRKNLEDTNRQQAKDSGGSDRGTGAGSTEDLKRLGMS